MKKHEFIQGLAEELKLTQKQTTHIVTVFLDKIMEQVTAGEEVSFPGFGIFKDLTRAARTVMHPRTQLLIQIAESRVPVFKAGKLFRQLVKQRETETETV